MNLRPSGYEPDELPGCSTPRGILVCDLGRPGGDLLSRALRRSTIGAEGFHGRVRDGIGCIFPRNSHQVIEDHKGWVILWFCVNLWVCCLGLSLRAALGLGWIKPIERLVPVSLHALLHFHIWPIDVMVYHGSQARPGFEASFPLRCFQRLSFPHIATRRCGWRHNRYTRGASIPVLSY